ncbi:hypothetical protein E3O19_15200 [Cryobacterium algoritolerans]|uniref:Lytic transglycosylase domain-containing protein n=1 Tax=Cryobacterium algoritolerans TaxID=1259184 RepID=A0A4R8WJG8_9MICO|nr:hypothetical protein [Cryobacterium algoritolerans]TFC10353.1 hypothetical protein E3O19_15200 [Cryobacterium algoritolerans]
MSTRTTDTGSTRPRTAQRRRSRFLLVGAIIAVGATIGTGVVIQSASAASNDRVNATAELAASTGRHHEQLGAYAGIANAQAAQAAKGTLDGANTVIAAAQGKSDVAALTVSVASLSRYTLLAPDRVYDLVDETKAKTAAVQATTAEADRVAAEQAAAAAAEAAKAAAAEAAKATAASTSSSSRPSAPTDPSGAQAIARDLMMSKYGWGADQFGCLVSLWNKESGWNVNSYNASSGAAGIPQALPGSKMATAGADWQTNPATQITWGLGYIAGSYGTPCAAWDKSQSVGWY